jgi:hypothetical protein
MKLVCTSHFAKINKFIVSYKLICAILFNKMMAILTIDLEVGFTAAAGLPRHLILAREWFLS